MKPRSDIPALRWKKRSDWLDVTSDVQPAAVGDGEADDTAALQAALDTMRSGSTVYFPPGAYRITETLVLRQPGPEGEEAKRITGGALIGCGRLTRIVWDGAADETAAMLWIKTGVAHLGRYVGIAWDGRGRAGIGIDHRSDYFETGIVHRHQAFRGFTDSGIRIGKGKYQSAEILFQNCLFEHCDRGIAYLNFNDYNNTIDGCEFRDCGTGVWDMHGNGYVRNCHFARSKRSDLMIQSEHGGSIRRCTSLGSQAFLIYAAKVAPLTIQQCHVAGWKERGGAILFHRHRLSPVLVMDSTFSDPPGGTPPIAGRRGPLIFSNNRVKGAVKLYRGDRAGIVEIPPGDISVHELPPDRGFLKSAVDVPRTIFDARRDFGAVGDGRTDDTRAIRATIQAARTHGRGALAYLPSGQYVVSETLSLSGSEYRVGGSGSGTRIVWKGSQRASVFHVRDADHLQLEHLRFAGAERHADVLQSGSPAPSRVTYEGLWVHGIYEKALDGMGLKLVGLGEEAVVLIHNMTGNLHLRDCGAARILATTSYYGNLIVEGRDQRRGGLIGLLTRFSGEKPCTLCVRDNQTLVISDAYAENAEQFARFSGQPGDPPGGVVIQGAKLHCDRHPKSDLPIEIDNYAGLIMIGHMDFRSSPEPSLISVRGTRPLDLLLVAAGWYGTTPAIERQPAADDRSAGPEVTASALGSHVAAWRQRSEQARSEQARAERFEAVFDPVDEQTLQRAAHGLDGLRRLGQMDLELNHPQAE